MNQRLFAAGLGLACALVWLPAHAAEPTAEQYKAGVNTCMRARDLECAEKNWLQFLRLRPTDSNAIANLGIVMNQRDNHKGAIAQLERAMDMGEGTYDLFSYYADSLEKVGRIDDAITWSYKALKVVPRLVDVRGKLAKLLVQQKKYYEALSLLTAFDEQLSAQGHAPYFEGQRIAIESALERNASTPSVERGSLRLSSHQGHFYAPVTLGQARPAGFVVDTGATLVTMDEAFFEQAKVAYKLRDKAALFRLADGRKVTGRVVTVALLKVGPYELKDIAVHTCKGCAPLLGQAALSRFDLKSSKVQGVEFLALSPRN